MAILSVIESDHSRAYGSAVAASVSDKTGREVSDAQVYVALSRLEHQGFITSIPEHQSKPSKRTRGRPRKFYELTATGKRALEAAGAYVNRATADQRIAKERGDGRKKKGPKLSPVVG